MCPASKHDVFACLQHELQYSEYVCLIKWISDVFQTNIAGFSCSWELLLTSICIHDETYNPMAI